VGEEPADGQLGHALQGPWLREQVAGAGHDLQPGPAGQPSRAARSAPTRSGRGRPVGRHPQRRPGAGACPKQADSQAAGAPLGGQPVQRDGEPAGQQLDVKAQAAAGG